MTRMMTLQNLEEITDGFSPERELGRGGFGVVYKGILQNGATVAVKRLSVMPEILDEQFKNEVDRLTRLKRKQFKNEVDLLMRLKHQNIVQLIGYCDQTQGMLIYDKYQCKHIYAETQEKLLCYEYLQKGSLDQIIYDKSRIVKWWERYKIIKGICQGLCYLHEEWKNTPIIHLDLKPANILLGENMMPKIADFGLSRLFCEEQTHTVETTIIGSIGYMAPEQAAEGVISTKSDIYSFGILILEIVTGQKNNQCHTDLSGRRFIKRVRKNWSGRTKIASNLPFLDEASIQSINKCLGIGLHCVEKDPQRRPNARQILDMFPGDCNNSEVQVNKVNPNLKELLSIDLHQLWFPLVVTEKYSCLMLLTNKTDRYIAYRVDPTGLNKYSVWPDRGVISPMSTCNVIVTIQEGHDTLSSMEGTDMIILESAIIDIGTFRYFFRRELEELMVVAFNGNDKVISKIYVKITKNRHLNVKTADTVGHTKYTYIVLKGIDQWKPTDGSGLNIDNTINSSARSANFCVTDAMQITVKIPSVAKTINLRVKKSSTVSDVKAHIEHMEGIQSNEQVLNYAGRQLEDKQKLSECGLRNCNTLHLLVCPADKFCIYINIRYKGKEVGSVRLDVRGWYTVADIKLMIESMVGFPSSTHLLTQIQSDDNDTELRDTITLRDQQVKNNDVLMLHPNVEIFIRTWDRRTLSMLFSMSDTVEEVWSKIEAKCQIKRNMYYLCYKGRLLSPWATLEMHGIERSSTITVHVIKTSNRVEDKEIKAGDSVHIVVRTWDGRMLSMLVSMSDTVEKVWIKTEGKFKINRNVHCLCYKGRVLSPEATLEMHGIERYSTIDVTIKSRNNYSENSRIDLIHSTSNSPSIMLRHLQFGSFLFDLKKNDMTQEFIVPWCKKLFVGANFHCKEETKVHKEIARA